MPVTTKSIVTTVRIVGCRSASGLRRRRPLRAGFSLLEIILSTAMLLAALTAIGIQTGVAVNTSLRTQLQSEGTLLCESLINERLASHQLESSTAPQPANADGQWVYVIQLEPFEESNLRILRITVWKPGRFALESRTSMVRLVGPAVDSSKQDAL